MRFNNSRSALILSLALAVSACSQNKTSEEYLSDAKLQIEKGNNSNALIELKNAARLDLSNTEVRLLLGSLYLKQGDAVAAEKELLKALELNANIDLAVPKLLKSLYLQDKTKEILSTIGKYENQIVSPETLLYKAMAHNQQGDKEAAQIAISAANDLSESSVYSLLGNAYQKAVSSNMKEALVIVNDVLEISPEFTEALLLKGQLAFTNKDFATAIAAFSKYQELLPKDFKIKLFLANAFIKNEQFDEADQELEFLLRISPEHAFSNQLKGIIYFNKQSFEKALAHTEKAIQNGLNVNSNRAIAGLSAFNLKKYELAYQYLSTVAKDVDASHPIRKILAMTQMQLGNSFEAAGSLEQLESLTSDDIELFTHASFELLKDGKVKEAKALLNKVQGIESNSAEDITKMGILKLSLNDLEGMTDLESAVNISPDLPMAKVALITAYIQNENFTKAMEVVNTWKNDFPKEVESYNLAAKIFFTQKEIDKAETELKRSLEIDVNNPYALLYFAQKHLEAEEVEGAIQLLDKLLNAYPSHLKGLALSYYAHKAHNTSEGIIEKIEKAYQENQGNFGYRELFARVMYLDKQFSKVTQLLEDKSLESERTAISWMLLGDSLLQSGNTEKALVVFDSWVRAKPGYSLAWQRKISTQEMLKDLHGALQTTEQALAISPSDEGFLLLRINYQILTKQIEKAQKSLNKLSAEQKSTPYFEGLQARIWLTDNRYADALPGLKSLYRVLPNFYNTALVFSTMNELNNTNEAFSFLKEHVNNHPKDAFSRNLLAETAINFDLKLSHDEYSKLLAVSPKSISVLNNFAWVKYKLGYYEEADIVVSKALAINENHPQLLDTAGLIKFELGDKEAAIKYLKQASLLAPSDKLIQQHYSDISSK